MDGHKDGNRTVITFTAAKLGMCKFLGVTYMKIRRSSAKELFNVACEHLGDGLAFAAVVADNTTANHAALALLTTKYPWLIAIFCGVHVLNLLIKDIVKLREISKCSPPCGTHPSSATSQGPTLSCHPTGPHPSGLSLRSTSSSP